MCALRVLSLLYKGCHLQPRHLFHHQPSPTHAAKHQPLPLDTESLSLSLSLSLPFFSFRYLHTRLLHLAFVYAPKRRKANSMITIWTFHAMAILCNWALVSSTVLMPPKDESTLRIFKEPSNEFEYIAKRHGIDVSKEDPDSKERRSTSSSFIRFGRSQSALDNSAFGNSETDSKVNRYPRWKSPDIVIRFGRSSFKTANVEQMKRGRNDNFIRYGRNIQIVPADVDLSTVCSALTLNGVSSDAELHPDVLRLLHLCSILNKIAGEISLDTFEDQSGSRHHE